MKIKWGAIALLPLIIAAGVPKMLYGQNFVWTQTSAPSADSYWGQIYWAQIASSADGKTLAALANVVGNGFIYSSTDKGVTWTKASVPGGATMGLACVALSSDGTKMVAGGHTDYVNTGSGFIFISTDSGTSWTKTSAPWEDWNSIASSADGKKLAATCYYGIWVSTNSGSTWVQTIGKPPGPSWLRIATSSDGTRLIATDTVNIYTSTNSGFNWNSNNIPGVQWGCVASSSEGKKLVAGGLSSNGIYISTNSGLTWLDTSAPNSNWQKITLSADGNRIVAGVPSGNIYASLDSGQRWIDTGHSCGSGLALSANGLNLAMCVSTVGVFLGQILYLPQNFSIKCNGASSSLQFNGLQSYPYILQATTNLTSTAWQPVATNFTDFSGRWSFTDTNSKSYSQRFYRALQQ